MTSEFTQLFPFTHDTSENRVESVPFDYEQEVSKLHIAYVDLLNNYGTSQGTVYEEREYPYRAIKTFKISSARQCPHSSTNL